MIVLKAKRGKDKKIRNGYPNLFSDETREILGEEKTGIANLFSYDDDFLGTGFFNRQSRKVFRLISTRPAELNRAFFKGKINDAVNRRRFLSDSKVRRVFNAEADLLPGLIVDQYNQYLVIQIRHPVLEDYKELIVKALRESPGSEIEGIYERSDFESSPEPGLKRKSGLLWGNVPEEITIVENGIKYRVSIPSGQKTGFFMDQSQTRKSAVEMVRRYQLEDEKALDLFCFTGAFSLNLGRAGMRTLGIDKSEEDIKRARENAGLNALADRCNFEAGDVFELQDLSTEYRLILLDPPSLIKSKKEIHFGKRKFTEMVSKALEFLKPPGILGICSCAYQIGFQEIEESLRRACSRTGCYADVIKMDIQSPDHPWLVQVPETFYLKCLWAYVRD